MEGVHSHSQRQLVVSLGIALNFFFPFFYSPNGRKLRSTVELERYLYENPGLQCDRDVTNCVQYKVS